MLKVVLYCLIYKFVVQLFRLFYEQKHINSLKAIRPATMGQLSFLLTIIITLTFYNRFKYLVRKSIPLRTVLSINFNIQNRGSLSTGTVIGAQIGGIPLKEVGTGTAIISVPIFIYFLVIAIYLAGGRKAIRHKWNKPNPKFVIQRLYSSTL